MISLVRLGLLSKISIFRRTFAYHDKNTYICRVKHLCLYISFVIGILLPEALSAQYIAQSSLRFESEVYDYGHIGEEDGSVVCRFVATNVGSESLTIVDVATSCGCTSAKYDAEPIAAGQTTVLEVAFDPMNRPGRIDKHIYVTTSDCAEPLCLHIMGYVSPRQRSVEELFPFDMGGGLRLQSNFHAFSYIEHGNAQQTRIGYTNTLSDDISVAVVWLRSSGALNIECPATIEAGATGDMVLTYSLPYDSTRYGTLEDHIMFIVDGKPSPLLLTTHAVAVDNFNLVDDISAPRAEISKNIIKFGVIKCDNTILEQSFAVRNSGEESLIIRCVEVDNKAVECAIEPNTVIAAGEQRSFAVRLSAAAVDPDEPFVTRMRLITNDALKPMHLIKVNALPE